MKAPVEVVPRIPTPVRVVVRNAIWTYGRATADLRRLPDFLILGAQRAGTSALYTYLREHPAVGGPAWKEVGFFDVRYDRGERWYRGHFPTALQARSVRRRLGTDLIVGEASPSYVFHPRAPERVAALLPDVRLIVLLRDPVDRALSHYHHEVDLGRESLPFEEALEREEERMRGEWARLDDPSYFSYAWWNHTYFSRGCYADQLERWLAVFSRERLLVLVSEEFFADPGATYRRVLEFIGATPHELESYPPVFAREYTEMNAATRRALATRYAEPNRRLSELLGRELPWA
jgi:hypothetical protein